MTGSGSTHWLRSTEFKVAFSVAVIGAVAGGIITLILAYAGPSGSSDAGNQSTSAPGPLAEVPSPMPTPTDTPTLTSSSTPADTPTPTSETPASPSTPKVANAVPQIALAQLQPVKAAEDIDVQEVKFGGTDYGSVWVKGCIATQDGGPEFDTWDVDGHKKMTVVLGVPSDQPPSGVGAVARFTFTDNGRSLVPDALVSAGHPKALTVPLKGVDDLTVGCVDEPGPSETSGGSVIAIGFGNATLS